VVTVELAGFRRANSGESAFGIAAEHGPVWHVGQADNGQRSCLHGVGKIAARRRLRGDPGLAAVAMDVDRDRVAQDSERGRCGLGGPRRFRRTSRFNLAGQHRADRGQRRAPDPGLGRESVTETAAIHGTLLPSSGEPAGRYRLMWLSP